MGSALAAPVNFAPQADLKESQTSRDDVLFSEGESKLSGKILPKTEWALDCRRETLVLVDHHAGTISENEDWQTEILREGSSPDNAMRNFAEFGELPLNLLLNNPFPSDHETRRLLMHSPTFSSIPTSGYVSSPFFRTLVRSMCRTRRLHMDLVRARAEHHLLFSETDLRMFRVERARDLIEQCKIDDDSNPLQWIPIMDIESSIKRSNDILEQIGHMTQPPRQLANLVERAAEFQSDPHSASSALHELKRTVITSYLATALEALPPAA
eukprot:598550_1